MCIVWISPGRTYWYLKDPHLSRVFVWTWTYSESPGWHSVIDVTLWHICAPHHNCWLRQGHRCWSPHGLTWLTSGDLTSSGDWAHYNSVFIQSWDVQYFPALIGFHKSSPASPAVSRPHRSWQPLTSYHSHSRPELGLSNMEISWSPCPCPRPHTQSSSTANIRHTAPEPKFLLHKGRENQQSIFTLSFSVINVKLNLYFKCMRNRLRSW